MRFRHPNWPQLPPLAPWWDTTDEEYRRRFPRLAAVYLDGDGGADD
ncbi:MAG TPA: hypothetical protein VH092_23845 [Urbifossiella sp.]|nr:hypothetical protein [Urbifossiella sp.]